MAKIKVIDKSHIGAWRKRWLELSSTRFHNDYLVAELAAEIRAEFPKGASGELQFLQLIRSNLKGAYGPVLLRKVTAFKLFTEQEWRYLGGWAGISFLSALTLGERTRIIASLKGRGPHQYSTIRNVALRLKIVSRQKGRDNRSQAEERVQKLQEWILSLYRTVKGLPAMPKDVELALTNRSLASLVAKANVAMGRPSS